MRPDAQFSERQANNIVSWRNQKFQYEQNISEKPGQLNMISIQEDSIGSCD